ncbi:DUF3429 domain-containing protein [Microbulbifer litoralis]|uniref:DUF3429 domain-containing protein n=1 Tax=Microbulbifer litoralis TaxID=2933965 RepID=UPI002028B1A9|nr:DUF3429 domain-containing protein [Microbulbifer sp. GX H0434]
MTQPDRGTRSLNALAYAGVLPFLLGIAMQVTGVTLFGVDGLLWFATYSATILSFLCGIWWGAMLNRPGYPHASTLTLLSNLFCIGAWVGVMLYRTAWGLPLLAIGYGLVAWSEARLNPNAPDLGSYFKTRGRVTCLVIGCHLIMIGSLWIH